MSALDRAHPQSSRTPPPACSRRTLSLIALIAFVTTACDDNDTASPETDVLVDTSPVDLPDNDTPFDTAAPPEPTCGATRLAPAPVAIGPTITDNPLAIPIDVASLSAAVTFDPSTRVARATSRMRFNLGPTGGWPVFDLRQPILSAELDGLAVAPSDLTRHTFGVSDPLGLLVLQRDLEPCSPHDLSLTYDLVTPLASRRSLVPEWTDNGVTWHSDFSDMSPGEYLERWFPAPLPHDDFAFTLTIDVLTTTPHGLLSNGAVRPLGPNRWRLAFPNDTDATTPLIYLAPATAITVTHDDPTLTLAYVATLPGYDTLPTPDALRTVAAATLAEFTTRFGPRDLDPAPYLLILGVPSLPGMEYRNGSLIGYPDISVVRHELLHAWFARSVRPARHVDAWFDEGIATFLTAPDDISPIEANASEHRLLGRGDPWTRSTSWGAHWYGAMLMRSLVDHFGATAFDAVLRDLALACQGHHITHHDLRRAFATLDDPTYVDDLWQTWVLADWDQADLKGDCLDL